jgi:putative cell wall-binding protein
MAITTSLVLGLAVPAHAAAFERIAGDDRFETSTEVSWRLNPGGAPTVVVASGENWPDALAGAPLAAVFGTSVVLARRTGLPDSVADEITRLGATNAYVLGGTAALDAQVEADLTALGVTSITRLGGADRYETAALIAQEIEAKGSTDVDTAYFATGANFPDALAAGPFAGAWERPILLVRRDSIPQATQQAVSSLGITQAYILGGTSVVGSGVMAALPAAVRLAGPDRYATAQLVAEHGRAQGAPDYMLYVACGETFADALAAGPIAAGGPFPLLLVRREALPDATRVYVTVHGSGISNIFIVGGQAAVSQSVVDELDAACPT